MKAREAFDLKLTNYETDFLIPAESQTLNPKANPDLEININSDVSQGDRL